MGRGLTPSRIRRLSVVLLCVAVALFAVTTPSCAVFGGCAPTYQPARLSSVRWRKKKTKKKQKEKEEKKGVSTLRKALTSYLFHQRAMRVQKQPQNVDLSAFSVSPAHNARLTIWTILRDFQLEDPFAHDASFDSQVAWLEALHTFNAVNSWLRLPNVRVILFGGAAACKFIESFVPGNAVTCEPIPCINVEFNVRCFFLFLFFQV